MENNNSGEYSSNLINTLSLIKVDLFFPWRIIIHGNKIQNSKNLETLE